MITALAGKAAGVQVNKNSSGMGGSAKITLRGVRSVSGDNQPLYVIDGVPDVYKRQVHTVTGYSGCIIHRNIPYHRTERSV